MAMQQGGLGLVLTILLVTIPPMTTNFFNGVLGQFSAYSHFGVEPKGGMNPAVVGPQAAAPRNVGSGEQTGQNLYPGIHNSPNPGAQVTASGARSTLAQPDEIKRIGG